MKETILAGDIGGTHCNFALLEENQKREDKNKLTLLSSFYCPSKEVRDFTETFLRVKGHFSEKHPAEITCSCLAVAGPVSEDGQRAKMTKLPWVVDRQKIQNKIKFPLVLINDFQAVGLGIDALAKKDLVQIKPGKELPKRAKAVLGAGTGLGKSILYWDQEKNLYFPLPSEGGHADFAAQDPAEMELASFIKKEKRKDRVSWDDLVSGEGIKNIYRFLESRNPVSAYSLEIKESRYDPALIFKHEKEDQNCQETLEKFVRFYARAAKNLALDGLAQGGVYLAGGIVAKNVSRFQRQEFEEEFINSGRMKKILQGIPVFAIADYNVSLYGAAKAALLHKRGELK